MDWISEIGISDVLDILFMSLFIYSLLIWFKKTRAVFVMAGILILSGVYVLARWAGLVLTVAVFQAFITISLFAVVVIFQEEIRYFFEQVALWSLNRGLVRSRRKRPMRSEVETLARTATDLAREKTGALIVLRGRGLLTRHLDGGVELGGKLSEPLLKSIFDPHSAGHDGALVVEKDIVTRFSCHLPLSKDLRRLKTGGTRHAAALGISEVSDALAIVISEERGTVSLARDGELTQVKDAAELAYALEKFYRETQPLEEVKRPWHEYLAKNSAEKAAALGMAVVLWFALVYGAKLVYRTYEIPVQYVKLPPGAVVQEIKPETVEVTFSGPRRYFYFLRRDDIQLYLKPWNSQWGVQWINVSTANLKFPKTVTLETLEPRRVRVNVVKNPLSNQKLVTSNQKK